jgi:hypothetical protein
MATDDSAKAHGDNKIDFCSSVYSKEVWLLKSELEWEMVVEGQGRRDEARSRSEHHMTIMHKAEHLKGYQRSRN